MKTFLKSLAAAGCLLVATSVLAQDYIVLDQRADEFDRWRDRVDYSYGDPVLSREFGVPVAVLGEQRARTGLGYGGLMIANALSRETGRSFEEIVAMKQSGMGWGRIAQDNGVKLGPIISRVNRTDTAFRSYGNTKRDQMKAAKFVNGHDARDGRLDKAKGAKIRGKSAKHVMKARGNAGKAHGGGKGGGKGKKK